MANTVTLLDASNNVVGTFGTIQAAVNAASNGYTVEVGPGTYQEQVTVNGLTNLTIEGTSADPSQTVILSPDAANLASNIQNPGEFHTFTDALVGAENGASVTIKNLTVNGNNQGVIYATGANGGGDLVGIEGVNASLTVSNVHVTQIEDVEAGVLQGGQGNKAIIDNDTNGSTQTLTVTGSTIDNFQKDGILMKGTGLTVDINNDVVTGVGSNPTNISQNLIELDSGATGSITQNTVTGVSDQDFGSIGVLMFNAGSGVTVSNNTVSGLVGNVNSLGIFFAGTDAPTAEGNDITNQDVALADDGGSPTFLGFSDPFNTALVQDNNTYSGNVLNYFFYAGPSTTNVWTVTGTGGPDDLEGGASNDVFTVLGGAPNGNVFVGNAGIDTVQGYGAGYHVAVQSNQWVVTNGTVTDTLTGIEKVVINGVTYDLVDNFGQDTGGFQTLQSAINAAQPGDVVVTDIGSASVTVGVDNLTFQPLQGATGITLTLASTGVHTVSLADYAAGQGVPVTVDGNDLGDTFRANDGGDTFVGGAGNDTIMPGAGADMLTGGGGANVFTGPAANLNGDTITDFVPGDKIVITDADPAHFAFHVSGTTLSFDPNTSASATFDTITLANAPTQPITEHADAVSGVDLSFGSVPYDFNDDAFSDLLFQNDGANGGTNTGTPQIWLWNGTAVSTMATLQMPTANWQIVGSGDFNGDGHADIVWQNTDGTPAIWEMNGTTIIGAATLQKPTAGWHILGIGDFNDDGRSDILWQNVDGTPAIWEMNGTTIIGAAVLPKPAAGWNAIAAGDFNGDGHADILWQNSDGTPAIWEMNGTTIIGAATLPKPTAGWHAVATGDVNGDGHADILWQNTDGAPAIWEMNGTTIIGAAVLPNPGSAWKLVASGNFTANGLSDLLFQNADGTPMIWEMNGTNVVAQLTLSNPGLGWQLDPTDPLPTSASKLSAPDGANSVAPSLPQAASPSIHLHVS
jgi:Ca2+-binding RTX toxin-like protein